MPRYPLRSDPVPRWALVVTYRGRRLLWTSDGQPVDGLTGTLVGSVEVPDQEDRIAIDGTDVREPVALSLPWLPDAVPLDLRHRSAELALVYGTWADRYVWLVGRIGRVEADRVGTLVGVEVQPEEREPMLWPPSTWVMDQNTWPSEQIALIPNAPAWIRRILPSLATATITDGPPEDQYGLGYPWVYGETGNEVPVFRAPVIDYSSNHSQYIIAAGGAPASSTMTRWVIRDTDRLRWLDEPTEPERDTLAQTVQVVDVRHGGGGTGLAEGYAEWWGAYQGNTSPTRTAGAGYVWSYVLSTVGAVDVAWCGEAGARTAGVTTGGHVDEPTNLSELFEDRVPGRWPLALRRAPSGAVCLAYVPHVDPLPVASMTEGVDLLRASFSQAGQPEPFRIDVRFAHDGYYDRPSRTLSLATGPTPEAAEAETVEAGDCYDDASSWAVGAYALWLRDGHTVIQADAPAREWHWLQPGHVVRYTDDELGVDSALWLVVGVSRTDRGFVAIEMRSL